MPWGPLGCFWSASAPRSRPPEQPVPIELPGGSLTAQGKAILAAAADRDLSPGQAGQMLFGLGALAKLIETDELEARIAALEASK